MPSGGLISETYNKLVFVRGADAVPAPPDIVRRRELEPRARAPPRDAIPSRASDGVHVAGASDRGGAARRVPDVSAPAIRAGARPAGTAEGDAHLADGAAPLTWRAHQSREVARSSSQGASGADPPRRRLSAELPQQQNLRIWRERAKSRGTSFSHWPMPPPKPRPAVGGLHERPFTPAGLASANGPAVANPGALSRPSERSNLRAEVRAELQQMASLVSALEHLVANGQNGHAAAAERAVAAATVAQPPPRPMCARAPRRAVPLPHLAPPPQMARTLHPALGRRADRARDAAQERTVPKHPRRHPVPPLVVARRARQVE